MSKYINKKIQEDLSLEEKLQYKKLLSERLAYSKYRMPQKNVKCFATWRQTWIVRIPSAYQVRYIADDNLKALWKSYYKQIKKFNSKISDLEQSAFEKRENRICKTGNIFYTMGYKGAIRRFLLEGKKHRDSYYLVEMSSLRRMPVKWKSLVRDYELSSISK